MKLHFISIIVLFLCQFAISKPQNELVQDTVRSRLGGKFVETGQFPSFGFFTLNSWSRTPLCSGSIIHTRWVLTSARCINNITRHMKDVIFTYGRVISNVTSRLTFYEHEWPESVVAHDDYQALDGPGQHTVHDIGLARLSYEVHLKASVQPIALAQNPTLNFQNTWARLLEWAKIEKQHIVMHLASGALCLLNDKECQLITRNFNIHTGQDHICGIDNTNNIRACGPDDGSPLIQNGVQIGVITVTESDCTKWTAIVATKVASHLEWIRYQMKLYSDYI